MSQFIPEIENQARAGLCTCDDPACKKTGALLAEVDTLRAEVGVAHERLGPTGYKIIQKVAELEELLGESLAREERFRRELSRVSEAGTPYWRERDTQNAQILENDRLKRGFLAHLDVMEGINQHQGYQFTQPLIVARQFIKDSPPTPQLRFRIHACPSAPKGEWGFTLPGDNCMYCGVILERKV
jgi:hypothetical protein